MRTSAPFASWPPSVQGRVPVRLRRQRRPLPPARRDGGRDIAADLAEHWRRCCMQDYGAALQVPGAAGPGQPRGWEEADWRELYELHRFSEDEKRRAVGQRLRGMWAADAQQRSSRSIQVPLSLRFSSRCSRARSGRARACSGAACRHGTAAAPLCGDGSTTSAHSRAWSHWVCRGEPPPVVGESKAADDLC